MNGFITRTAAGLSLGTALTILAGCVSYRQVVDPCWPERYNALARGSVNQALNAQAWNGHILDQTVWDYFFTHDPKTGLPTDVLNEAGQAHLSYLARRRPVPDLHLYLQTAQDLSYQPSAPERLITARAELNTRRIEAIQKYMNVQLAPCGITTPVEVAVFDPAPVGVSAIAIGGSMAPARDLPIIGAVQKLNLNFQGAVAPPFGSTGGGGGGGGGSSGAGSGAGGGGSTGGAGR